MGIPASRGRWVQALQAGSQGKRGASRGLQRWPQEVARRGGGSPTGQSAPCPTVAFSGQTLQQGRGEPRIVLNLRFICLLYPVLSVTYHRQKEKHGRETEAGEDKGATTVAESITTHMTVWYRGLSHKGCRWRVSTLGKGQTNGFFSFHTLCILQNQYASV